MSRVSRVRGWDEWRYQPRFRESELSALIGSGAWNGFLRLVVKGDKPMIVGASSIHSRFELLPGPQQVIDRLNLKGTFDISRAKFTDAGTQAKIDNISRRASGNPNGPVELVETEFIGNMALRNATAVFSHLTFAMTGARIDLSGSFGLRTQAIDFHGTAATEAKISQMTTGSNP